MKNRILSLVAAGAVLGGLVSSGCGSEAMPAASEETETTAAVRMAAREMEDRDDDDRDDDDREDRDGRDGDDGARDGDDGDRDGDDDDRVSYFRTVLDSLRAAPALAPLFDAYQVPDPVEYRDSPELLALLRSVRISAWDGRVVIRNRQTGAVIFSAPLADLARGEFHPENVPGGTGTPPPAGACTSFTYSAWGTCQPGNTRTRSVTDSSPAGCTGGSPVTAEACTYVPPVATCSSFTYAGWSACQPGNTQSRIVTGSSPAGCTGGSPVTSQACTYVPPTLDGAALFGSKCSGCHGPLATTDRRGKTAAQIVARHGTLVTAAEADAIAKALAVTAPATCSAFSYSAWGACQPGNTQTRSVTGQSPAGCTGGSPVTSQACTYVPPVTTCSAFSYSAWGACQPGNTQTRSVTGQSPAGCTGGSPVTSQACTYVPPACTYTYSAWSACSASGTQTRTVASSSPTGCSGTPVLTQSCTPPAPTTSCTTCHAIPPATGKHAKHANLASCQSCHGTGYSTTTAPAATHPNGVKNVTTTIGWNATSRSCANSCHGSKAW
jgi:hypothetical protein